MLLPLSYLQITADNILPFNVDEENLLLLSLRHISKALPHTSAYFRITDMKAASKQSTVYITLRVNRQVAQRNTGSSNKEFHKVRDSLQHLSACMLKLQVVEPCMSQCDRGPRCRQALPVLGGMSKDA